ncbi:lipopolysaccharide assembly LapA domain-containing protein [Jatrophihabitans sp. GAS493]|uniref:LapA family protein n=1 Tax=Jatrophihabitans sp. GAS493 TaxID=1907575 RepID=UPI0012FE6814|nr:lipopolysaccharide assembly protein LapA domain-containing protein [Jatrophihabitans sp. GAS493]
MPPTPGLDSHGRVRRTRASGAWVGLITATLVLILLVVFIAQNTAKVTVHFLGFHGELSLGLMLLIAALCGVVIAALLATARILQLRKALKANGPKK